MGCPECRWKYPPETKIWCKYFDDIPVVCHRCEIDKNQEITNLLKEIADNKEIYMMAGPIEQDDAIESRYQLSIHGPERLVKKLADILWEVE